MRGTAHRQRECTVHPELYGGAATAGLPASYWRICRGYKIQVDHAKTDNRRGQGWQPQKRGGARKPDAIPQQRMRLKPAPIQRWVFMAQTSSLANQHPSQPARYLCQHQSASIQCARCGMEEASLSSNKSTHQQRGTSEADRKSFLLILERAFFFLSLFHLLF